jgi:hypothetical protein
MCNIGRAVRNQKGIVKSLKKMGNTVKKCMLFLLTPLKFERIKRHVTGFNKKGLLSSSYGSS